MKKTILMGIAALIVMSGANMTAFAQRIPGRGLQQAAYMNAKQLNNLTKCGAGGCSTDPRTLGGGGCATAPRGGCNVGCGAPAPIACCPLSALKNIPRIIPSVSIPDCGSPAPCLTGMKDAIGRVFVKSDPECKPSCVAPAAPTPGACRITSPGIASIKDCNPAGVASLGGSPCDSGNCNSGACQDGSCNSGYCQDGSCHSGACQDGTCHSGNCQDGSCNSVDCQDGSCNSGNCQDGSCNSGLCGPAGLGGSICSGLGGVCGGGLSGGGMCGSGLCGNGRFSLFWDDGWNMPVKTPITRNPVSYSRYRPTNLFGSPNGGYPGSFPMIYRPTDTTQLGYTSHNVPYWKRTRSPGMPSPASIQSRNCPTGAYTSYGQGYNHRSHHSYPWFQHHMTNASQPGSSAANIAARGPVRRPVPQQVRRPTAPRRVAQPQIMQTGLRRTR